VKGQSFECQGLFYCCITVTVAIEQPCWHAVNNRRSSGECQATKPHPWFTVLVLQTAAGVPVAPELGELSLMMEQLAKGDHWQFCEQYRCSTARLKGWLNQPLRTLFSAAAGKPPSWNAFLAAALAQYQVSNLGIYKVEQVAEALLIIGDTSEGGWLPLYNSQVSMAAPTLHTCI